MEKTTVQNLLDAQPDHLDVDRFVGELYLRQQIEAGEADVAEGRVLEHEDAKRRLSRWLA
ncbi:MAG: hypothetical protein ACRCT8_08130 [Lacipirellulaceae bacterium]